jgi:hypothetical protein
MTERFLVVGEPVEYALPYDRHYDCYCVGLPDMCAQNVVSMFDRTDNEDVPAHGRNVPVRLGGRLVAWLPAQKSGMRDSQRRPRRLKRP